MNKKIISYTLVFLLIFYSFSIVFFWNISAEAVDEKIISKKQQEKIIPVLSKTIGTRNSMIPPTDSTDPIATIVKGAPLLREFAFQPNPIIIQKDSTVTWNNEDVVTHTVTSGSGFSDPQMGKEFDSGLIGKTFKHIFKKSGEYPYFCQVHPLMQGKVIVK